MSFNYSGVAKVAKDTIDEFGWAITLTKAVQGTYNPVTGEATVTKLTQKAKGVILDYGTKDIDGTLIRQGDKQLLMSPLSALAQENYTVLVGDATYTIISIKDLNPGGTSILLDCNIRL